MPTHEQELALQVAQMLVRIDALKFELARAHERITELEHERDQWRSAHNGQKAQVAMLEADLGARVAALEAERDRWRDARADLQTHHNYHLAKMTERIRVLEDTLNEIYHRTDSTTQQMEIINEVLPQKVTE